MDTALWSSGCLDTPPSILLVYFLLSKWPRTNLRFRNRLKSWHVVEFLWQEILFGEQKNILRAFSLLLPSRFWHHYNIPTTIAEFNLSSKSLLSSQITAISLGTMPTNKRETLSYINRSQSIHPLRAMLINETRDNIVKTGLVYILDTCLQRKHLPSFPKPVFSTKICHTLQNNLSFLAIRPDDSILQSDHCQCTFIFIVGI